MAAFPVLFVCVGNVCRSPFGERLLAHRLAEAGATPGDVRVTSAGTMAARGSAVHPLMAAELRARGADPDGFEARQISPVMVEGSGLVITATRAIRSRVLEETPAAFRRTFTVLELAELAAHGVSGISLDALVAGADELRSGRALGSYDVADPIQGTPDEFAACAAVMGDAVDRIVGMFLGETPAAARVP